MFVNAQGVGKVVGINSGKKGDSLWVIARVTGQVYDGKDENGKSKRRAEYASLMMRGSTAEAFLRAVKEGKVIQFAGAPRAGKVYTPRDGGESRSGLEIDLTTGFWDFVPTEKTEGDGSEPVAAPTSPKVTARRPEPEPVEDTEDPDYDETEDPFAVTEA